MNKWSQVRLVVKRVQYLSNCRTSKAAVGSPLEFGDTLLFGGTDGAPEGGDILTAGTGFGLYGMQIKIRGELSVKTVATYGITTWNAVGAHLEAVDNAPRAKKLALTGVLGRPGKDLVGSRRHCRRTN